LGARCLLVTDTDVNKSINSVTSTHIEEAYDAVDCEEITDGIKGPPFPGRVEFGSISGFA